MVYSPNSAEYNNLLQCYHVAKLSLSIIIATVLCHPRLACHQKNIILPLS